MSRIRFVKLTPWVPPWIDRILDYGDEPWGTDPFYSVVHGTADTLASGAGFAVGSAIGLAAGTAVSANPIVGVAAGVAGGTAGAALAPIIIEEMALEIAEVVEAGEVAGVPLRTDPTQNPNFKRFHAAGEPTNETWAGAIEAGFSNPTTDALQGMAYAGMFGFLRWVIRMRG